MLGYSTSVQITYVEDIKTDKEFRTTNGQPFLIKNIGDVNVVATIELVSGTKVETVLYPGWNVEICSAIVSVKTQNAKLQIGY